MLFGIALALQARGSVAALRGSGTASPAARVSGSSAAGSWWSRSAWRSSWSSARTTGPQLRHADHPDPGLDPDHVLFFNTQLAKLPDAAARGRAAAALMDRPSSLPGVASAGAATGLPTVTPQRGTRFEVEGRKLTPEEDGALFMAATPGVFEAWRTPVLSGRAFQLTDTAGGQPVVLINRTLANTVFAGAIRSAAASASSIRSTRTTGERSSAWLATCSSAGSISGMDPTIYTPFSQTPFMWAYVMVRTTGDPSALTRSIKGIVRSVDPNLIASGMPADGRRRLRTVAEPRLSMLLVSGFCVAGADTGERGHLRRDRYSVSQRTHELGLRMALGAGRAGIVLGMIIREGLVMAAIGIVAGLGAAALATRLMGDLLVGITARDPLTFGGGAVLLLLMPPQPATCRHAAQREWIRWSR